VIAAPFAHVEWPLVANEELMPYFARLWVRDSRHRPAPARFLLEPLEERTMLSGSSASLASTQANIASMTALQSSLNTAIVGSSVTFIATVENASTGDPITSGKVKFVIDSPQKTVLGDSKVNKEGQAGIATTDLTKIGDYRIEAQYTPSSSNVSASSASPVTVRVVPVPLNVPTVTTISSVATSAEVGQALPLTVTVKDAGTGVDINAGTIEPLTGSVAFLTAGPDPIVLGEAKVNNGQAAISSSTLRNPGPYQIIAEFLPANNYYAESTSAPIAVTINATTTNAPTVTSVQTKTSSIETGQPVVVTATVGNADSSLANGAVEFVTVGRHPIVLGTVPVGLFGQQVSLASFALRKVGTYQVDAVYLPNSTRFAESTSAPVTIAVTPLTAASFRVTPVVRHGLLSKPLGFTVTALNSKKQPITSYTGTVVFSSPTDSWTIFPKHEYATLGLTEPPAESTLLASFNPSAYTFTTADGGSHTFLGGVTFGKGGAEVVKVAQADDSKVSGRTTFSIG
jgi:Bacterial Ig-like domain (group 3)